MLRKEIIGPVTNEPVVAAALDVPALARVLVTSEERDHPVELAFDGSGGPGGTRWIAASGGDQSLILAFDRPTTVQAIHVEIEERDVVRTQELQVAVSTDGGKSYREVVRQEYNFSPGTSFERERWVLEAEGLTHLRLVIRPDKGGVAGRASLTTLALEG